MSNIFSRVGGELGRWSNQVSDRLEKWGIPDSWAKNWGTMLTPGAGVAPLTDYYADRQRGGSSTHARQFATNDSLRSLAAALAVYGGAEAAGAYGGAGAGAGGSSGGSAAFSVPSVATGAPSAGTEAAFSVPSVATGGESAGAANAFSVPSMTASPQSGSFLSGINYQKLLGNALNSQSKASGSSQPVQNNFQMQPIQSSPAVVGSLNPSAPQGLNPALLSLLLGQR